MSEAISVLHVDDEPDVLELSTRLLERQDSRVSVTTAASGSEGMDVLATRDVDCIVSDSVRMPTGESFVEAASRTTDAPIVLFTAKEWEDVAPDAIAAEVTEYVRKADASDYKTVLRYVLNLADVGASAHERLIGSHDFSSATELGVSITQAVESVLGGDVTDYEPLYDVVDTGVLERLFAPVSTPTNRRSVTVTFEYMGLNLCIDAHGRITLIDAA